LWNWVGARRFDAPWMVEIALLADQLLSFDKANRTLKSGTDNACSKAGAIRGVLRRVPDHHRMADMPWGFARKRFTQSVAPAAAMAVHIVCFVEAWQTSNLAGAASWVPSAGDKTNTMLDYWLIVAHVRHTSCEHEDSIDTDKRVIWLVAFIAFEMAKMPRARSIALIEPHRVDDWGRHVEEAIRFARVQLARNCFPEMRTDDALCRRQ